MATRRPQLTRRTTPNRPCNSVPHFGLQRRRCCNRTSHRLLVGWIIIREPSKKGSGVLKKAKRLQNADAFLFSLHNGLWVRPTFSTSPGVFQDYPITSIASRVHEQISQSTVRLRLHVEQVHANQVDVTGNEHHSTPTAKKSEPLFMAFETGERSSKNELVIRCRPRARSDNAGDHRPPVNRAAKQLVSCDG